MSKKKAPQLIRATGALFLARTTQRYLFLLRDDDTHSNTWGLVGGRVENNETIFEALQREINEEVGELPAVEKVIPLDLYCSPDGRFEYHTFAYVVENEFIPRLNHEHKGYCWTPLNGVPKPVHPALYNSLNMQEMKLKLDSVSAIFNPSYVSE